MLISKLPLILIGGAIIFGWTLNIGKLIKADFEAPYMEETVRAVGVFVVPVGVAIGYMDLEGRK